MVLAGWAMVAGGAAEAGPAAGGAALSVTWHDPAHALPFDPDRLAAELAGVLQGAGVALSWQAARPDTVTTGPGLRVVLLPAGRGLRPGVMGTVPRRSASRTAWVSLANVERTLGLDAPLAPRADRELSRALARVIAHELVHLVAPELPHSRGGLMAPRLGRGFLTAPGMRLAPAVVAALRAGAEGRGRGELARALP
jgi:hypothetical protein